MRQETAAFDGTCNDGRSWEEAPSWGISTVSPGPLCPARMMRRTSQNSAELSYRSVIVSPAKPQATADIDVGEALRFKDNQPSVESLVIQLVS